jgi:hypothetical protein
MVDTYQTAKPWICELEFEDTLIEPEDAQEHGYYGRRPQRPDYTFQGVTAEEEPGT